MTGLSQSYGGHSASNGKNLPRRAASVVLLPEAKRECSLPSYLIGNRFTTVAINYYQGFLSRSDSPTSNRMRVAEFQTMFYTPPLK